MKGTLLIFSPFSDTLQLKCHDSDDFAANQKEVINILINEKTQKIFWFLWRNREEPFTIREISRLSGVSYGSCWSVLMEIKELRIIYGFEKKKAILCALNFENSVCFHVWSLLNALNREKLELDRLLREKVKNFEDGLAVYYSDNGVPKIICCSKTPVDGIKSTDPKKLKDILRRKKELFRLLWNEGIVLAGEKEFFTFMWGLTKKRVIGVSA